MSRPNPAQCDVCGTYKREVNHWFKVAVFSFGFLTTLRPTPGEEAATDQLDICGEACLHKFVSMKVSASKSQEGAPDSSGNSNTEGGASTFNHQNAVELNSQGVASAAPAQGDER